MAKPAVVEQERAVVEAADLLDRQAEVIADRWVDRLQTTLYRGRTDLHLGDLRAQAPRLVRAVAQTLRLGRTEVFPAAWAGAAEEHARLHVGQRVPLGDLVREYWRLRQEMRGALRQYLGAATATDVYDVAGRLGNALACGNGRVDLHPFICDLFQRLGRSMHAGSIREQVPEGLALVSADPGRLERILTNLLSNALNTRRQVLRCS